MKHDSQCMRLEDIVEAIDEVTCTLIEPPSWKYYNMVHVLVASENKWDIWQTEFLSSLLAREMKDISPTVKQRACILRLWVQYTQRQTIERMSDTQRTVTPLLLTYTSPSLRTIYIEETRD